MRLAKRRANVTVRKDNEDIPNGNYYRRIVDRWSFPDDGKAWYNHPKQYRK